MMLAFLLAEAGLVLALKMGSFREPCESFHRESEDTFQNQL